MMSIQLQIALIIASLCTLIFVAYIIKKQQMNIRYSIIWILWSVFVLIIGIFPQIANAVSKILGISTAVNTVFLVMLFLIYLISFYAYLKISTQERTIRELNYHIATIDKKIDDLKANSTMKD